MKGTTLSTQLFAAWPVRAHHLVHKVADATRDCSACMPLETVCCHAQAINRGAEMIECQNANVDLEKILGITAFSLDRLLEEDPDFLVSMRMHFGYSYGWIPVV